MSLRDQALSDVDQLFSNLIRALTNQPEQIETEVRQDDSGKKTFIVRAPQSELGKIIGVNGRSARALRLLLVAVGNGTGQRYTLDIQAKRSLMEL